MGASGADVATVLSPVFELAKKYDMKKVRDIIGAALQAAWPDTLEGYDALQTSLERRCKSGELWMLFAHPEPASSLVLAHQLELDGVLRTAMYDLARLSRSPVSYEDVAEKIQGRIRDTDAGIGSPDLDSDRLRRAPR